MHTKPGSVPPPLVARRSSCTLLVLGGLALGLACAPSAPPRLPPVSRDATHQVKVGKFVWMDLVTQDTAGARSFYSELFGWTYREGDRYIEVLWQGEPIAGIVAASDPDRGSEWIGNLSVADVDRATVLTRDRGGEVEREPVDAPDRGRLALITDPEGALLLLVRATDGDPPDRKAPIGGWLWRELWSRDVAKAEAFYRELVGYQSDTVELEGEPYRVLRTEEGPRAGIVSAPPEVHPLWLPYVRVQDPERVANRAAELGARVVMKSEHAAILVDPTGAPFGVQLWEHPDEDSKGSEESAR